MDLSEATGMSSVTGKFLSANTCSIFVPTNPVAPTTATFIINSDFESLSGSKILNQSDDEITAAYYYAFLTLLLMKFCRLLLLIILLLPVVLLAQNRYDVVIDEIMADPTP